MEALGALRESWLIALLTVTMHFSMQDGDSPGQERRFPTYPYFLIEQNSIVRNVAMCALKIIFIFNIKNKDILFSLKPLEILWNNECSLVQKLRVQARTLSHLNFIFLLQLFARCLHCSLWHSQAQQPELAPELAVPGSPQRRLAFPIAYFLLLHSPQQQILFLF